MSNFIIEINNHMITIAFGSVDPEFITDLVGDFVPYNSLRNKLTGGEPLEFKLTFTYWNTTPEANRFDSVAFFALELSIEVDFSEIYKTKNCQDETLGFDFMYKLGSAIAEFHELRNEIIDDPEETWFSGYQFSMDQFRDACGYIEALKHLELEEYGPESEPLNRTKF